MKKNLLTIAFTSLSIGLTLSACQQTEKKSDTVQQSQQLPQVTTHQTPADSTHLVGVWFDEAIKTEQGEQIAYEIVAKSGKTYIQVITFTGKKLNVNDNPELTPTATELKKSGEKYVNIDNPNETYSVDKDNNLLVYDETGLVMKCKRML